MNAGRSALEKTFASIRAGSGSIAPGLKDVVPYVDADKVRRAVIGGRSRPGKTKRRRRGCIQSVGFWGGGTLHDSQVCADHSRIGRRIKCLGKIILFVEVILLDIGQDSCPPSMSERGPIGIRVQHGIERQSRGREAAVGRAYIVV